MPVSAITSDGQGGLWVTGANRMSPPWYAMHRTRAGVWSRAKIVVGWAWNLARIPGTAAEISVGSAFTTPVVNAEIWAHGAL